MILPIYAYGHKILKKVAKPVTRGYPDLGQLILDMWQTMYNAKGVGLAAPQVGISLRLFVVDTIQLQKEEEEEEESEEPTETGIKGVFINPEKLTEPGEIWTYEEGCLSIPAIRGDIDRPREIYLKYYDEHFNERRILFRGMNARVIQHEYDHLEGVLFTELIKPVKKNLIRRKLDNIRKGKIEPEYPMVFT